MTWTLANIIVGLSVAAGISYIMGKYGHLFNKWESTGSIMIAAMMVLTIGPLLSRRGFTGPSPYDDWSGLMLRIGLACLFYGTFSRLMGWSPAVPFKPVKEPNR